MKLRSAVFLAASSVFVTSASAASVYYAPIGNGETVKVTYMGDSSVSQQRIEWLVLTADRSSCTNTPLVVDCDGFMSSGDRVVVGDHYMAFMDLTRTDGYGGGGGGLLRGLWGLVKDSTGNPNFKYLSDGAANPNHAPNNLYPYQNIVANPDSPDTGDAHEILAVRADGVDPENSYRASSVVAPVVDIDGYVAGSGGGTHVFYQFSGELTGGTYPGNYHTDINYGTGAGSSKLYYTLNYWFHNALTPSNGYIIQSKASIEAKDRDTAPMETIVFSLGLSNVSSGPDFLRLTDYKPHSHSMTDLNMYLPGCERKTSAHMGSKAGTWNVINTHDGEKVWRSSDATTQFKVELAQLKYGVVSGSDFRMNIYGSVATPLNMEGAGEKIMHQVIYDRYKSAEDGTNPDPYLTSNKAFVYDVKLGSKGCQQKIGVMEPGDKFTSEYYLEVDYDAN